MIKLKNSKIIAFLIICVMFFTQTTYTNAAEIDINQKVNNQIIASDVRLQDDFYSAINSNWLKHAVIEDGMIQCSTTTEVNKKLLLQKKSLIQDLIENKNNYSKNSNEIKIINLYNNFLNTTDRNKQGAEPIKKVLNKIDNIQSLNELTNINNEILINPIISFSCEVNLKNSNQYALYVNTTTLSLDNPDDYIKPTETSQKHKELRKNYYTKLLTLAGYSENQSKLKVENLFKFEYMIAPYMTTLEESIKNSDYVDDSYNIYTLDQLNNLAPNLDIKTLMKNEGVDTANTIILSEPKWLKGLNDIYTEDNLQLFKDYLEIYNLSSASIFLDDNFRDAVNEFNALYCGVTGESSKDEDAIDFVDQFLAMPFGKLYVEKYFSNDTKKDVESITDEIISTYRKRIKNLNWMSNTTKEKALEKLDKIKIKVGYPDTWDDYSSLNIKSYDEGGSLYDNICELIKFSKQRQLDKLNSTVDKSKFVCSPQTINAFYSPTSNSITIPAGILQEGFYDKSASKEHNLGAIGSIIGHEISHAFDNNGSKFDCDGNLNNWWEQEDEEIFNNKTDKVRNFYSTVKVDNGKFVDGYLTVGENISDIAGVACTLDILDNMQNPNYKDFFESYANMWKGKFTDEVADILLYTDEHAPNKVRVNITLAQFNKFYETYNITPNDKMYIKSEDRLLIW